MSSDVGEMVKAMRRAIDTQRRRDRRLDHRPERVQRPDGARARARASRSSPTTPTAARRTSGSPTSARTTTSPGSSSARASSASSTAATSSSSSRRPGQQNIQPRVDGALDAIRDSGRPIRAHVVASGVDVGDEREEDRGDVPGAQEPARPVRRRRRLDRGRRRGDARSTGCTQRGVRAGGYDLLPATLRAIHDRHLDFTIDQQPYLQGFLPVLQLFLDRYSGGLVAAGRHEHRAQLRHPRERRAAT